MEVCCTVQIELLNPTVDVDLSFVAVDDLEVKIWLELTVVRIYANVFFCAYMPISTVNFISVSRVVLKVVHAIENPNTSRHPKHYGQEVKDLIQSTTT